MPSGGPILVGRTGDLAGRNETALATRFVDVDFVLLKFIGSGLRLQESVVLVPKVHW